MARLIMVVMSLMILSSCAYVQKAAFKSAEAAQSYCENNTAMGRELVRQQLAPALVEKDIAMGLRCPGDDEMFIVGDPKTIVSD